MQLLKILFIIISVLWLLKMIARLLLPVLFKKLINKVQNQAAQHHQDQTPRPDGKIKVSFIPPRLKEEKLNKAGDFVDYEDVK